MEIDSNKPLWQMTAGEFVDLMNSTLKSNEKIVVKELPKFLTFEDLAGLTGYSVSTIKIKNSKKKIPGSKKLEGKILFDSEKIIEWIESGAINKISKEEQIEFLDKNFSRGKRRKIN